MDKIHIKQLINAFSEVFRVIHQRSYHNVDEHKLYPGQAKLLSLIREQEGLTQKELADKNFVTPATITGMLLKLETSGYVHRIPDEDDKRIMRVYLTPAGFQLAETGEKHLIHLTELMFHGFTKEEIATYLELTRKIRDNLQ